MKNQTKVKVLLLLFIAYAVYAGHKKFFNDIPDKLSDIVSMPADSVIEVTNVPVQVQVDATNNDNRILDVKFSSKEGGSIVERGFARGLNWILDDPRGKAIFKEAAHKMLEQQGDMIGYNLLASRYLVRDEDVGTGKEVSCSDTVEISYTIHDEGSAPKKAETVTFVVGSGTLAQGLENGVIGMREGGKRIIVYPSSHALNKTKGTANNATAEVNLISIKQKETRKNVFGAPLFNKPASSSKALSFLCGDMVSATYTITKLEEKGEHRSGDESKVISFKIGSREYPNELSEAIIGLPVQGSAEVFFITTLNTAKIALNKDKNYPRSSSASAADSPVLLKFKLQEGK